MSKKRDKRQRQMQQVGPRDTRAQEAAVMREQEQLLAKLDIPIAVYGKRDERAVNQLLRCAAEGSAVAAALMADHHVGYSQPIGGVIAYAEHVSPSGAGYDIGCLSAGTRVSTADGYWRAIEDVIAADRATCWDTRLVRPIEGLHGAIERGLKKTLLVELGDGRVVQATPDHEFRTKTGWIEAKDLKPGAMVACTTFEGLPWEAGPESLDLPAIKEHEGPRRTQLSRSQDLAKRGWWPVRTDDPRFPALLRLFAFCLGDGNLSPSGKNVSFYTSVLNDALTVVADLERIGWTGKLRERVRGGEKVRRQFTVTVGSVSLHALFAAMGCPIGKKVDKWDVSALEWLLDLPNWMRAHFLSGLASAEANTPALATGSMLLGPLVMKQSGRTPEIAEFIARLVRSLEFECSIYKSGPEVDGVQSYQVQLLGGQADHLRFYREVGFCLASEKRIAAAEMTSIVCQAWAEVAHRQEAIDEVISLVGVAAPGRTKLSPTPSGMTVADAVRDVSRKYEVPEALLFHGRAGRGAPRVPKGWQCEPDASGDIVWLPVASVTPAGVDEVYDIATADPAQAFIANGVVVHNCGVKAIDTGIPATEVDLPRVMDEIAKKVSFGLGRPNNEPVDHPVLDKIRETDFRPQREMLDLAAKQLGTVGSGNHYVSLLVNDEDGHLWIATHFGSRGFGHKTASGFLAMAQGLEWGEHAKEGEMDSPPVLFHEKSELGELYIPAMELASEYAYAGRDVVIKKIMEEILQSDKVLFEAHEHHNFVAKEKLGDQEVWVVRKGATAARPGQVGFVGGSMGTNSAVIEGMDTEEAFGAIYSAMHGAGRVMSRTKAAGKWRKVWVCGRRGCDATLNTPSGNQHPKKGACPKHPNVVPRKQRIRVGGAVDWNAVRKRLKEQGIELRGGGADEAPEVYKDLQEVIAAHTGHMKVRYNLRPLGTVMAGDDVVDPFKD